MARLCERPGCSEPGAVAYGMRPQDLVFWVAHLDRWNDQDARVLCRRHADAMVVPRGWTLDDRREPVPRLFRPPPVPRRPRPSEAPAVERAPRRRTSRRDDDTVQLPLDTGTEPAEPAPEAVPRPDAESAASHRPAAGSGDGRPRWAPAFDTDDDLDGLLEVRSPLLARAFRGEQRSERSER